MQTISSVEYSKVDTLAQSNSDSDEEEILGRFYTGEDPKSTLVVAKTLFMHKILLY